MERPAPLGERGHDLGLVDEEGGVPALALHILAHQLVQQPRCGLRRRALHLPLLALLMTQSSFSAVCAHIVRHVAPSRSDNMPKERIGTKHCNTITCPANVSSWLGVLISSSRGISD